jgi:hypothetical protein
MMTSHGVLCGRSFLSCCFASSFSAIVRQLRTIRRADNKRALGPSFSAKTAAVETKITCHYAFPVGDDQYAGVSIAAPGVGFGQTVTVYYDSQDPRVSALEDFSEQSRKNMRFVYFLVLTLAATIAFILWDRAPYRP